MNTDNVPEKCEALAGELAKAEAWYAEQHAKASDLMQGLMENLRADIGVLAMYRMRGHLEAQAEYIERTFN